MSFPYSKPQSQKFKQAVTIVTRRAGNLFNPRLWTKPSSSMPTHASGWLEDDYLSPAVEAFFAPQGGEVLFTTNTHPFIVLERAGRSNQNLFTGPNRAEGKKRKIQDIIRTKKRRSSRRSTSKLTYFFCNLLTCKTGSWSVSWMPRDLNPPGALWAVVEYLEQIFPSSLG